MYQRDENNNIQSLYVGATEGADGAFDVSSPYLEVAVERDEETQILSSYATYLGNKDSNNLISKYDYEWIESLLISRTLSGSVFAGSENGGLRNFRYAYDDLSQLTDIFYGTPEFSIDDQGNSIEIPKLHYEYNESYHRLCLLYTSPSPRDKRQSRMPSSA